MNIKILSFALIIIIAFLVWVLRDNKEHTILTKEKGVDNHRPASIQERIKETSRNQKEDTQSDAPDLVPSQNSRREIVLEKFEPTLLELESFYARSEELEQMTLGISGLYIDRRLFQVNRPQDLPLRLKVPLPEGDTVEFDRKYVDFENKNSFVWQGGGKDLAEYMQLSFYRQAIVGHLKTKKGYYEIEQLSPNKLLIRQIDTSQLPELINDTVPLDNIR